MSTAHLSPARRGVLRHSRWDALPVALAALHGALLLAVPSAPVVAIGLWWNSNTVAHYFLHRPFFRRRTLNVAFALYLSMLLGVPQTLWRDRHLAHHAGRSWRLRLSRSLCVESALVLALWAMLLALAPAFFLTAYLPGYVAGLGLCWLHGHYEHADGGTISHRGALYNFLFLNDGYHVEHHAHPGEHWTRLPAQADPAARLSAWPAVLRWLETPWLELLERGVLRSPRLQRFLLDRHERAFAVLLPRLPDVRRVAIVGGGLWPRTVLVLRRLLPAARLIVIDRSAENLAAARPFLPADVEVINDVFDPARAKDFDLVVLPLSLLGDREALYRDPPAPALLVHDWVWRRRGAGAVVSWLLLKRLEPGDAMRALSLFLVFVTAKLLVLAGREVPLSPWAPLAYFWQDALVALAFAGVERLLRRRPRVAWALYAVAAGYAALNVPLACLLSTPLTWPLLRATGATIADSIGHHVTAANLFRVGVVVTAAALLPRAVARLSPRLRVFAGIAAVLLLPLGPMAVSRVATNGLHRNALAALVTSALPRVPAADMAGDWTVSPLGGTPGEDLSRLRGRAAGRNVVVVHLESTGANYLKPYGAAEDPMPRLTALGRHALLFENAYTTYPETIRSFFATQCAVFPALDTRAEDYEPAHAPALAGLLAAHGYRTGLFHPGRFRYLGMEEALRNRGYQTREDAGDIGGERESSFGIDEASAVRRMLAWLDERPGEPFLLTYLPIAGHHPYDAPAPCPFPDDADVNRYRNALHYADDSLAALLDGLRERGLEDNTLFVICGDHGEAFGQHQGNYGHTLFLYEENVRVPLLVAAPGLIDKPVRVGRVVSLVDLAPTVLDLLGLPVPSESQGRSLLSAEPRMALFCTDYSLGLVGLRDGRWKMIHELDSGRSQLFDVEIDHGEKCDLSGELPERTAVYREHLLRWAAAQKYRVTRKN